MRYTKEEILKLEKQVRITKEVFKILKKEKKKQGISMAKIVCNLIFERYENKEE